MTKEARHNTLGRSVIIIGQSTVQNKRKTACGGTLAPACLESRLLAPGP